MKIRIPFTKKQLHIFISNGGSVLNGNGFMHKTLNISLNTIVGTGDDGTRGLNSKLK